MARGDLLKKLFLAYQRGEDKQFKEISLEIISDERSKNHNVLADQLQKIISTNESSSKMFRDFTNISNIPKDDNQIPLVELKKPKKYLDDVVLSPDILTAVRDIIEEYWKSDLLKRYNLKSKSKILFCGPPGCGKTLCAEAIAGELGLPIIYNRFDSIISSYLGDTAANIRKVFDYAKKDTWVLLFDEFDAIGKSRNDPHEHGELKRVVNSFLQILDEFESQSIIIACTNHEGMLDKAIWRRFDEILYFDLPDKEQIIRLIQNKTKAFPKNELNIDNLIKNLKGLSHADIERVCMESIKLCVLNKDEILTDSQFEKATKQQLNRLKIYKGDNRL